MRFNLPSRSSRALLLLALGFGSLLPLGAAHHESMKHDKEVSAHKTGAMKQASLIAVLAPTEGNTTAGTVVFKPLKKGQVEVIAHVTGLNPGSSHAIHIHEWGDVRAQDGLSAGDHYNPEGHPHGLPSEAMRHAGDFGNLEADENGEARFSLKVDNISLMKGKNPVIGRSIVVHAKADDGGQPTGNAGPRIATGVIGVMNPGFGK